MIELDTLDLTKWKAGDFVTHNYHGGEGKVLEKDDTHSKVSWTVDAPPHIKWYYNTELSLLRKG